MLIRQASKEDIDAIELLWKEMAIFHQEIDSYFTIIPEEEANHQGQLSVLSTFNWYEDKSRNL